MKIRYPFLDGDDDLGIPAMLLLSHTFSAVKLGLEDLIFC